MDHDAEFYNRIREYLKEGPSCPASVWQRVTDEIRKKEQIRRLHARRRWFRQISYYAVAAGVLVTLSLVVSWEISSSGKDTKPPTPAFLLMTEEDDPFFQNSIRFAAGETHIPFDNNHKRIIVPAEYTYQSVSLREGSYENEPVAEFVFCRENGQKTKLVAVPAGGVAAAEIGKAVASGTLPAAKSFGHSVVGLVGTASDVELLNLVSIAQEDNWALPSTPTVKEEIAETYVVEENSGESSKEACLPPSDGATSIHAPESIDLSSSPEDLGV